jgi:hypothetical protein
MGRSVQMAMGAVVTGVIRRKDWFRNNRAGSGWIPMARIDTVRHQLTVTFHSS